MKITEGGVCAAKGFKASGIHCGIRKNKSKRDLSLIYSEKRANAAAVYTTNLVKGAPLTVTKQHISDGYAQAVICNSGNANTCNKDGEEVAEIYVDDVDSSVATPPLLLKDFQRVFLKAGEEKTLDFELDEKAFRLMGLDYRWTVEPGEFRILAGASSRDIRCETQIVLSAEDLKQK